ncbi:fumarylacetoacetate hydrolase family protein [Alkalicaulis satelles]|uniref:Fumarylacetoacetate hydrolase family protein n=1 Tax=Alkalicaulis satelles TaxID=2609175 RepID=A0A5M6ZL91_9PROT|nr:fumarylacetoacetate hydrolase family protein [Alkalicaulis satelles]KAA5804725.1 fumarylacetoacetate hydrolase family protein [Alkalicaulis satelles]
MSQPLAFDPPAPVLAPVSGGQFFPVRRIYCVGRNYADHAREMGADPQREAPFFFSKPRDALVTGNAAPYPPATNDLHHEVELVLALGRGGADLSLEDAQAAIWGAAVGIDLTRRDLQAQAKKAGRPWDTAKGFDASAPMGVIRPGPAPSSGPITLNVNGQLRQSGDLADMIWSGPEIIAHLSRLFRLEPGDLIFTGTPAGVAAVSPGDVLEARAADLAPLSCTITPPA